MAIKLTNAKRLLKEQLREWEEEIFLYTDTPLENKEYLKLCKKNKKELLKEIKQIEKMEKE